MTPNLFIALEGIDGCGKSTQAKLLAAKLQEAGYRVHVTFEPTDSPIGKIIREIFNLRMEADHRTIAALFAADRLHHLLNKEDGILKMLEQGYTVISDRYYFSSYAYHGTHMPMDWVIETNAHSATLLRPDVNIYIDMPPEKSMERLNLGRESIELYETLDNLRNVRQKYLEAFENQKGKEIIFVTDGNRPVEQIAEDVWEEVTLLLNNRIKQAV